MICIMKLNIWYHFLICTCCNGGPNYMKHSFSSVHFTTLNSLALLWACIGHDFFQVNRELKKLLVASVGDDLQYHFERVAREKNQLILENEALGRNTAQLSEQLERMSIQCDVWRSKFLASRYFLQQIVFHFLVFAPSGF